MGAVHSFIPEILGKFIDAVEPSHNQPLQVKLIGNPQIKWNIQGIVVGHKRTGRGTPGDRLQNRGLHFEIALFIEEFSDAVGNACPF